MKFAVGEVDRLQNHQHQTENRDGPEVLMQVQEQPRCIGDPRVLGLQVAEQREQDSDAQHDQNEQTEGRDTKQDRDGVQDGLDLEDEGHEVVDDRGRSHHL